MFSSSLSFFKLNHYRALFHDNTPYFIITLTFLIIQQNHKIIQINLFGWVSYLDWKMIQVMNTRKSKFPPLFLFLFSIHPQNTQSPLLITYFFFTHSTLTFHWWIYQKNKIKQFSPSLGSKNRRSRQKKRYLWSKFLLFSHWPHLSHVSHFVPTTFSS